MFFIVLAKPESSDLEPLFAVARTGDRGSYDTQARKSSKVVSRGQRYDQNSIFVIKLGLKSGPAGKDKQWLDSDPGNSTSN